MIVTTLPATSIIAILIITSSFAFSVSVPVFGPRPGPLQERWCTWSWWWRWCCWQGCTTFGTFSQPEFRVTQIVGRPRKLISLFPHNAYDMLRFFLAFTTNILTFRDKKWNILMDKQGESQDDRFSTDRLDPSSGSLVKIFRNCSQLNQLRHLPMTVK